MKIAVVGCGAVGSFYGGRLCRAGHEVHFLLRSDYEVVRERGVWIRSVDGDFHFRPQAAREAGEIGPSDWVLVALKTTANRELGRWIPPLVGPETRLLTLQNGLGNEEALAAVAGSERALGGLCFVCLNRIEPGVIRHTAHGNVVLGEHRRLPGRAALETAALFRSAGVECRVVENLDQAHWEKLVWNIPFNGLGVAGSVGADAFLGGGRPAVPARRATVPVDALLADPRWERLVRGLMGEVIAAGRALGYPLDPAWAEEMVERSRCMGAYRASTLLDYERGLPLELESLFCEPLRRARAAGVSTPLLGRLCEVLTALDAVSGGP
ncbi:MAG TPA: 2-dehydropantoate 2-reductase [Verrucomicrobiota bacterium]|nr:2-dehydropantoate 2-reductase [Verrucomicrobiota bacterium]HNU49507.1 2-dehydropantoate 2-reductase [Verrucomicrobiota bacterium]